MNCAFVGDKEMCYSLESEKSTEEMAADVTLIVCEA